MAGMTDRGQLLLAGACILAVTLIGLTLIFSSGGYTTTLSNQDTAVERGTDAVLVRQSVEADLERYLTRVNNDPAYTTYTLRVANFRNVLTELGETIRKRFADHGRFVDVEAGATVAYQEGYQIELATDDDFDRLDSNGDGTETVASDTRVRNLTFVFSEVPTGSSSFGITFDAGSATWLVTVTTTGGTDWHVTVERPSGSYARTCTVEGTATTPPSEMTVNISEATVDGNRCPPLGAIDLGNERYDVTVSGDLGGTEGRLWMTVRGPRPSTSYDEVIYSVEVPFHYNSATVAYRTDIHVAPGEIR
jgi:hypothetical protein